MDTRELGLRAAQEMRLLREAVGVGDYPVYGICDAVCSALEGDFTYSEIDYLEDKLLVEAFREWPQFSGESAYPVPSPDRNHTPAQAFHGCLFPMWEGAYGELRLSLLDFCIDYFEDFYS